MGAGYLCDITNVIYFFYIYQFNLYFFLSNIICNKILKIDLTSSDKLLSFNVVDL